MRSVIAPFLLISFAWTLVACGTSSRRVEQILAGNYTFRLQEGDGTDVAWVALFASAPTPESPFTHAFFALDAGGSPQFASLDGAQKADGRLRVPWTLLALRQGPFNVGWVLHDGTARWHADGTSHETWDNEELVDDEEYVSRVRPGVDIEVEAPTEAGAGSEFTARVTIEGTSAFPFTLGGTVEVDGVARAIPATPFPAHVPYRVQVDVPMTCTGASHEIQAKPVFDVTGDLSLPDFDEGTLEVARVGSRTTVELPVCVVRCAPGEPSALPRAIYVSRADGTRRTALEGIAFVRSTVFQAKAAADVRGTHLTLPGSSLFCAGADGWSIVDVVTGNTVHAQEHAGRTYYAVAPRTIPGIGGFPLDQAVGVGAFGADVREITNLASPGPASLRIDGRNVTDVCIYGSVGTAMGAALADFDAGEVRFLNEGGLGLSTGLRIRSTQIPTPSGGVVSACREDGASPVLFVTDGTPGELWVHPEPGGSPTVAATRIGVVGDAPRRVRSRGRLVAISNFGSDTLTIAADPEDDGTYAITETVGVGDGPVGLDLGVLPDGNFAVISTGFNDDTYSVTIVTPAGALVSTVTTALPVDGRNPGHAAWLRDGTGKAAISCNGTDGLVYVVTAHAAAVN